MPNILDMAKVNAIIGLCELDGRISIWGGSLGFTEKRYAACEVAVRRFKVGPLSCPLYQHDA